MFRWGIFNLNFFSRPVQTGPLQFTISANTTNVNIFDDYVDGHPDYVPGATDIELVINSGVYVGSTSTGTDALDTGTGYTSGDTLKIVNYGTVTGKGGSNSGGAGGDGFNCQWDTTIENYGTFCGGGGGGGNGGSGQCKYSQSKQCKNFTKSGGAGGDGAGYTTTGGGGLTTGSSGTSIGQKISGGTITCWVNPGDGKAGGNQGVNGTSGTGASRSNASGCSGGYANSGAGGGTRGYYAKSNGNTITWSITGTRLGQVS